jgi:hypothetical protein
MLEKGNFKKGEALLHKLQKDLSFKREMLLTH